ncbi:hypothetical protein CROQUDRAFT_87358 [Cronartium quercuum f. sp. fusiforme G11]|uniref:Iron hydrogenase large subunit C-terminal domain-containing protein n=1 Tax=Cronartium quercuum f. sp. fusiforme G11 TaxID=708437 RepID=A0A9P6TGE5_9BASI|nr:hypothetical protein CROQUDRAFT_87358 [Cronartium quercuum f. sp. fusiforme G11]
MAPTFAPSLIDLNDYLGPSQICIKPVQQQQPVSQPAPSLATTEIRLDGLDYDFQSTANEDLGTLKKAEITLNDCLACSGCVTSSESILVSLQSDRQLYETLSTKPNLYPVLSLSAQSLASLAAYNDIDSMLDAFLSLERFFIDVIGFKLVLDMGFAQALSLRESRLEFQARPKQSPLLASSCPGWICYAEKTQGKEVLQMISTVRSAQQIQGALVKSKQMAAVLRLNPEELYHVSVMSCYDKKLEASRDDFVSGEKVRDVDCVLTSGEVQKMIDEKGWDLRKMAQGLRAKAKEFGLSRPENQLIPNWIEQPRPKGSSSGGYLFNVLRSVLLDQPAENASRLTLSVDRKRGADYSEFIVTLKPIHQPDDAIEQQLQTPATVLFRGAHCYGFKNLQNLVRKVKGGTKNPAVTKGRMTNRRRDRMGPGPEAAFDYVEVMACPSGCVNGGGQIPAPKFLTDQTASNQPPPQVYTAREWVVEVERKYFSDSDPVLDTMISAYQYALYERAQENEIDRWLQQWIPLDEDRLRMFRTQYHAVAPETNGFAVQW